MEEQEIAQNDTDTRRGRGKRLRVAAFVLFNAAALGMTAFLDFSKDRADVSGHDLLDVRPPYLLAVILCFAAAHLAETAK
jgi:hypothetical protein